tara:strand:- start:107 stop:493 length:387 start_codon:yes stop_codon:yes gene_type:complete
MTSFGTLLRAYPGTLTEAQVQEARADERREIKTEEDFKQLLAEDPAALLVALITQTKIENVRLQANPAADDVVKSKMILPKWFETFVAEEDRNILVNDIVKVFVNSGYEQFRDEAAVRDAVWIEYARE